MPLGFTGLLWAKQAAAIYAVTLCPLLPTQPLEGLGADWLLSGIVSTDMDWLCLSGSLSSMCWADAKPHMGK